MCVRGVCVVQSNIQRSCDGGMGVKRVEKIAQSKWMSTRRISLWQLFYIFHQKSLPGTVYILTWKKKKKVYFSYFCTEKNQSELCWFPAVSWVIYISFEIARWNFVSCCIDRCMQSLTAVLKSVMQGKFKYVLSPVPYSLVNQLLVKSIKIFISTNKIITKLLICLCFRMSYIKF